METINLKKLFLKNFCGIWLLILGSTALSTSSSEEAYENIKVLITAKEGLQFSKEDSYDGRKIIYDCGLGLRDTGLIKIFDEYHPEDMKSLVIKNCRNLTLSFDPDKTEWYGYNGYTTIQFKKLRELKVINVTSLELSCGEKKWSHRSDIFETSIRNVRFLNMSLFCLLKYGPDVFLKLQNVSINNLYEDVRINGIYERPTYDGKTFLHLYLKNVKIEEIQSQAIQLQRGSNLNINLTVEDSYFGNVHAKAFQFKGTVRIMNSSFSFLDEAAFKINSSDPVLFSGNRVKTMLNPFYIVGSEVNIIDNTFDSIETPWLSKIIGPDMMSFRTINISGNTINHWNPRLFYLNSENVPDLIIFDGNYLNCFCKHAITFSYKFEKYIEEVFLNKHQKNYCQNLGNCLLAKSLGQESGICRGNFQCPEDDQNSNNENAQMWPLHIKSILSVLKNIDTKLDQIVSKYNSSLSDKST